MNIVFVFFCNSDVGMGHYYRSMELVKTAQMAGHKTWVLTDKKHDQPWFNLTDMLDPQDDYLELVDRVKPDWVVADFQMGLPDYIYQTDAKICAIDGIAQPSTEDADLILSQGLEGIYCAPKYLILRKELFLNRHNPQGKLWFVFGGAADKMGLLKTFHNNKPDEYAYLINTEYGYPPRLSPTEKKQTIMTPDGAGIFPVMSATSRAAVAMGMTVWELVAMGIPSYVFSRTPRHLASATDMASLGLVKAYHKTGLPDKSHFNNFLDMPFSPNEKYMPDRYGAQRCVELLESK